MGLWEEWLDLFDVWRLQYRAHQQVREEKGLAWAIALWAERCELVAGGLAATAACRRGRATCGDCTDIADILTPRRSAPRLGTWG
jgi:hypothetical protein